MKDKETAIEKSVKRGELRANENKVEKEKKKQQLDEKMKEKNQELQFKQKSFDIIKDQMQDPLYVSNLRNEVVASVYQNIDTYNSKFTLSNMEGKDALIMAVDNFIADQTKLE